MKKIMMYIGGLSLFFLMVSCEKWLTIQPENEVEKSKLFASEEGFWQALNGMYYLIRSEHSPEGRLVSREIEYLAGVWDAGSQTVEYRLTRHEYKNPDVDNLLGDLFLYYYNLIAHANTILQYVDQVDFLPEKSYSMIKGEAMAIRAWTHFNLIRLWGPVPANIDVKKPYLPYVKQVSKVIHVYDNYESFMGSLRHDLDTAESLLGKAEPLLEKSCEELNVMTGGERAEFHRRQHRFNYYALLGLRARFALWMNNKEEALQYAMAIKEAKNPDDSPKFRLGTAADVTLTGDYTTNDNTLYKEHLFSIWCEVYNPDQNLGSGNVSTSISNMSQLFSDDDQADLRYKLWWSVGNGRASTYKYRCRTDLNVPLMRLAEMYLIMIEAAPLEQADQIYKEYCESRDANYIPLTEESRSAMMLKEYYRELLAEGQLFFAAKRLNANKLLWPDGAMTEAQYVLPIPRRETEIFN